MRLILRAHTQIGQLSAHEVAAAKTWSIWLWNIKQEYIAGLCGSQQQLLAGNEAKVQAAEFTQHTLPFKLQLPA